MTRIKTIHRLTGSFAAVLILAVCLAVTTLAVVRITVTVNNNQFHTGTVEINLNDGKKVIEEHEFLFEPGMTVEKSFFLENNSTWDVYYKVYLKDISGGLADTLIVTVLDGETILCSGTASELTRSMVQPAEDELAPGGRKDLIIRFYYPPGSGNTTQGRDLFFTVCAEATQTKNNPNRLFNEE